MMTSAVLFAGLALTGCGDDDSGSSSGRLTDEAFCAEIAALEQRANAMDEAEILAEFARLAAQAPNDELRAALEQVGRIAEQIGSIDEDDPDSFGEAMSIVFNPANMAAMQQFETYVTETCGLELDSGDDFGDGGFGDDGGDDTFDDGRAFEDLDASAIREALRPTLDAEAPDANSTGISIFSRGGVVVVQAQVFDAGNVDALAICEALGSIVDEATSDPDVELEVTVDDDVAAVRSPGATCATP
jgi:hypothetical protein